MLYYINFFLNKKYIIFYNIDFGHVFLTDCFSYFYI